MMGYCLSVLLRSHDKGFWACLGDLPPDISPHDGFTLATVCGVGPALERDMAQWLERSALPMSLPVVWFRIPLGAGFQRNIMFLPFQYWDIVSMMCHWARHLTLKCFT